MGGIEANRGVNAGQASVDAHLKRAGSVEGCGDHRLATPFDVG